MAACDPIYFTRLSEALSPMRSYLRKWRTGMSRYELGGLNSAISTITRDELCEINIYLGTGWGEQWHTLVIPPEG